MTAPDMDSPSTASSTFEPNADELLARNAAYAEAFDDHDLGRRPASPTGDRRLHGLAHGDLRDPRAANTVTPT